MGKVSAAVKSPRGDVVLVPQGMIKIELARLARLPTDSPERRADVALLRLARQLKPEYWPN